MTCISGCALGLMHGNPPSLSCPKCVFQIAACTCEGGRAELESLWGFSTLAELPPPVAVTATRRASPVLQTWERQDQFHSNAEGKESDEAMERLRKDRKAAFNLMDLCPECSYKNHSGFSPSRSFLEGKFLLSYVTMRSSLSVAICT